MLPDTLDIVFVTADLGSITTRQRRDEHFRTGRSVRRNDETSLNRPNAQKLGFKPEFLGIAKPAIPYRVARSGRIIIDTAPRILIDTTSDG